VKRLTSEGVGKALRDLSGNLSAAGRRYGVTRQAISAYVKARPSLQAILTEARETMKDNAESTLYRAVLAGASWAICFFLKCQAKDRGYVERQEMTGKDGQPVGHVEIVETVVTSRADAVELLARLRDQERPERNGQA
jgi:hypothetical protein